MSRHKLNLLSREDFAAFSLHDENAYLQRVCADVQEARGRSTSRSARRR